MNGRFTFETPPPCPKVNRFNIFSKRYSDFFQWGADKNINFLRNFCLLDMGRKKKFLEHVQWYKWEGVKAVQQKSKIELFFLPCGLPYLACRDARHGVLVSGWCQYLDIVHGIDGAFDDTLVDDNDDDAWLMILQSLFRGRSPLLSLLSNCSRDEMNWSPLTPPGTNTIATRPTNHHEQV